MRTRPLAYELWPMKRAPIGVRRIEANGNIAISLRLPRRAWHFIWVREERRLRRSWTCNRDCPNCRVWPPPRG